MPFLIHCVYVSTGHGSVDDMLDAEKKRLAENLTTKVSRQKSVRTNEQITKYIDRLLTGQGVTHVLSYCVPRCICRGNGTFQGYRLLIKRAFIKTFKASPGARVKSSNTATWAFNKPPRSTDCRKTSAP